MVECTDAWCAKFALPKFANAKWANFASFCVKVYGKSFVDFYWQKLRFDLCKYCNLRKLYACGTNSLHVLSGACVLHFPKSKLRILSQDAIPLLKSLKFLQLSLGDSLDSLKPPLQAPLKPP